MLEGKYSVGGGVSLSGSLQISGLVFIMLNFAYKDLSQTFIILFHCCNWAGIGPW